MTAPETKTRRRVGRPLTALGRMVRAGSGHLKLLGVALVCYVLSLVVFFISLVYLLRMHAAPWWKEALGLLGLFSPLIIFPLGAWLARGIMRREIRGRGVRELVVLVFVLLPLILAYPTWLTLVHLDESGRHPQVEAPPEPPRISRAQQEAWAKAFASSPISVSIPDARSITHNPYGGTLEMTVRVEGAPSGLPPVVLEVVGLGDGEQYDVRAAGVRVVIRQGHRRVVASRSGHVLKSGLDSSRIRVRYSTPPSLSLGPPDSVSLRIALRQGAPLDATEVLDFPSIPIALETRPADQDHP